MSIDDLKVDISSHIAIGMKILTREHIKDAKAKRPYMKYHEDVPFEPEGATFEKACEIMKKMGQ